MGKGPPPGSLFETTIAYRTLSSLFDTRQYHMGLEVTISTCTSLCAVPRWRALVPLRLGALATCPPSGLPSAAPRVAWDQDLCRGGVVRIVLILWMAARSDAMMSRKAHPAIASRASSSDRTGALPIAEVASVPLFRPSGRRPSLMRRLRAAVAGVEAGRAEADCARRGAGTAAGLADGRADAGMGVGDTRATRVGEPRATPGR